MADTDYTGEIWKDIPGYEGFYQASSLGRIKSVPRTTRRKNCGGWVSDFFQKGFVLTQRTTEKGYLVATLSNVTNGKQPREFRVNRLVCAAFCGPSDLEAAHNNGVRTDNRSSNLRWATRAENMRDVSIHHAMRRGGVSSAAKQ